MITAQNITTEIKKLDLSKVPGGIKSTIDKLDQMVQFYGKNDTITNMIDQMVTYSNKLAKTQLVEKPLKSEKKQPVSSSTKKQPTKPSKKPTNKWAGISEPRAFKKGDLVVVKGKGWVMVVDRVMGYSESTGWYYQLENSNRKEATGDGNPGTYGESQLKKYSKTEAPKFKARDTVEYKGKVWRVDFQAGKRDGEPMYKIREYVDREEVTTVKQSALTPYKVQCPPMVNGKRAVDSKSLKMLERCIQDAVQTKKLHTNKDGEYTDERLELHNNIIQDFKKSAECVIQEKPIAILTGGAPGSGKSTYLKKHMPWIKKGKIYHIDADEVRATLPEYEGWNAPATHLEAKDIVNKMIDSIGKPCKHDLIYDGTMNKAKSYMPLLKKLKSYGYRVFVIYIAVPKEVSTKRVLDRYVRSGRFVPLHVIDEIYENGLTAYNEVLKSSDGYIRIDGQTGEILGQGGDDLPSKRDYEYLSKEQKTKRASKKKVKQTAPTIDYTKIRAYADDEKILKWLHQAMKNGASLRQFENKYRQLQKQQAEGKITKHSEHFAEMDKVLERLALIVNRAQKQNFAAQQLIKPNITDTKLKDKVIEIAKGTKIYRSVQLFKQYVNLLAKPFDKAKYQRLHQYIESAFERKLIKSNDPFAQQLRDVKSDLKSAIANSSKLRLPTSLNGLNGGLNGLDYYFGCPCQEFNKSKMSGTEYTSQKTPKGYLIDVTFNNNPTELTELPVNELEEIDFMIEEGLIQGEFDFYDYDENRIARNVTGEWEMDDPESNPNLPE